MAIHAGRHRLGPDNARITLQTTCEGLAAKQGHDLLIEPSRWSGDLVIGDDQAQSSLKVIIDVGSLTVLSGSGGLKPLTDKDKGQIAASARETLSAGRHPEASFTAAGFEAAPGGCSGTITGTFALAGQSGQQELQVSQTGPGRYRATTTVRQTGYGIKPFSAFLGTLKVCDPVQVTIEVDLSAAAG